MYIYFFIFEEITCIINYSQGSSSMSMVKNILRREGGREESLPRHFPVSSVEFFPPAFCGLFCLHQKSENIANSNSYTFGKFPTIEM